jgi:hypothetical protein
MEMQDKPGQHQEISGKYASVPMLQEHGLTVLLSEKGVI